MAGAPVVAVLCVVWHPAAVMATAAISAVEAVRRAKQDRVKRISSPQCCRTGAAALPRPAARRAQWR
jgi:hypothetical protein